MRKIKYNKKFYTSRIGKFYSRKCYDFESFIDGLKDKKICGCSLSKYVPSLYRESMGATGSQSTHYWFLDKIFDGTNLIETDSFIDIGCGKGRIIAYLLSKKAKCRLSGVELNADVAEYATAWAKKYENVHIFQGDAFKIDYNPYNVILMARPFEKEFFAKFIDYFESNLKHPARVIYVCDTQSGDHLVGRKYWTLMKREWVFKKNGLYPIYLSPQRYSVWDYEPPRNHPENI